MRLVLLRKCPHTSHVEGDQFLNCQHAWPCWDDWLPQPNVHFPWPNVNWHFVQILMASKSQSKFYALDTHDVGQSAWYCFTLQLHADLSVYFRNGHNRWIIYPEGPIYSSGLSLRECSFWLGSRKVKFDGERLRSEFKGIEQWLN